MQDGEVFHDSGAVSPMTNPDEDQSLNAYIEGLEHIQVRLGQGEWCTNIGSSKPQT